MKRTHPVGSTARNDRASESRKSNPRGEATRRAGGRGEPPLALVTGGAGFIGTNITAALVKRGYRVRIFDNLARPGVAGNLAWLQENFGDRLEFQRGDVADAPSVRRAVQGASRVFHFAAQVAVTTSLEDPVSDFRVNALGTLNVLEACRAQTVPPRLLFTSTNKVYGGLPQMELMVQDDRYTPVDKRLRRYGIDEWQPLDFHSPYGCSKGTADQYVLDYARCYSMPNVVFRMSCIYGPHQHGTEDQGWVAHFARCAAENREVIFYGDGRQVRDLLFVEDLARAMLLATDDIEHTRGRAFNVGGGTENAASLRQVVEQLGRVYAEMPRVRHDDWRPGDQRCYVSDIRQLTAATGWRPQVSVPEGLHHLCAWLADSRRSAAAANGTRSTALVTARDEALTP